MQINTSEWKEFKLSSLFDVTGSRTTPLEELESEYGQGQYPYHTTQSINNGVAGFYNCCTETGNVLTVDSAVTGQVFWEENNFSASDHVEKLVPKFYMSKLVALFLVTILNKEQYRYNYGRKRSQTKLKSETIRLPATEEGNPDWEYMELVMGRLHHKEMTTEKQQSDKTLNEVEWAEFRVGDLFPDLKRGKVHSQDDDLTNGDDVYYVGAKLSDNGIMSKVAYDSDLVFEGNCIVFICNGEGSVGYAFYQDREFAPSGDLKVGYNEHLNQYNGVFVATVLCLERPRYSFGRKWGAYVEDTIIKLPAKNNKTPDWEWMELYIKSLPMAEHLSQAGKSTQYTEIMIKDFHNDTGLKVAEDNNE